MPNNIYKVIFVKNKAISCDLVQNRIIFEGDFMCEQNKNGQLIYAFIKAKNEAVALITAADLINKTTEKTTSGDFIL